MFSRSVMVSTGISKLSLTDLIFVDPRVKINGGYYRDMLLSQQLLPMMRDVSDDFLYLSARQHICTPGTRHCAIS